MHGCIVFLVMGGPVLESRAVAASAVCLFAVGLIGSASEEVLPEPTTPVELTEAAPSEPIADGEIDGPLPPPEDYSQPGALRRQGSEGQPFKASAEEGARLGLRMGYVEFTSSHVEIDDSVLLGLFRTKPLAGRITCEAGMDFSSAVATDGSSTGSLVFGRLDFLLPAGSAGPLAGGYFLCGVAGAAEITDDATGHYRNFVGIVNMGAGFGIADGKFDLRFTYSLPTGSKNTSAISHVSVGMMF